MTRAGGRKLELICILCNESLADLESACAGLRGKTNKHENNNATPGGAELDSNTVLSEANSTISDALRGTVGGLGYVPNGPTINPPPHYGGYIPLTDHNHKQVVATKCGHMFHQGCLRKHVHKTLIEGKGGSLFCPMCTRPFAMNRLWPVIIPPTKAQRERYLQLNIMKEQNGEMVKQLKEIRSKIADEEERLKRIKEDSEQCLHDIQQKQKLLDSVNGPTNKEMAELTKVHMKRQEILHVVTQHNADLLKLLAEESNISTATAENMINVNVNSHHVRHADINQNYLPEPTAALSGDKYAHRIGSGEEFPSYTASFSKKGSRKTKNEKACKKTRSKKKSRRHHHYYRSPSQSKSRTDRGPGVDFGNETELFSRGGVGSGNYPPAPLPSELIPPQEETTPVINRPTDNKKHMGKSQCRKVDTFTKWKMESMKELMCLPGLSEMNTASNPSTDSMGYEDGDYSAAQNHHRQNTSQKDSVNILLSRKPNMMEKHGFRGISKKE